MELNKHVNNPQEYGWKWKPIVGFILCILLTAGSLWTALYSGYSPQGLFILLAGVAFIQAIMQLLRCEV
ncbi:hypothetical protein VBD025_14090 [Virgibacillus flavescens]|uniref:hypothetical protein n=1 Tax=Virgibacillus flavescens TaxID=1611422 RepID=UPI003D341308